MTANNKNENKKMSKNQKEQIVENTNYESLKAVAQAYADNGVTASLIYKRSSRGLSGNDLIPEQKRKNYVEPESENKNKFTVGGVDYKSGADACRILEVKYGTYKKRKRRGWTDEEALGLVPKIDKRKSNAKTYEYNGKNMTVREMYEMSGTEMATLRDRLSRKPIPGNGTAAISAEQAMGYKEINWDLYESQSQRNKNRKPRKAKQNKKSIPRKKKGKEIWVNGRKFPSITAAAEFHDKRPENVWGQLLKGDKNKEQIFGLEPYKTSRSVEYKGKLYPSLKALAMDIDLSVNQLYRIPRDSNFESAVEKKLTKRVLRGRRNEAFFKNNPELGASVGYIYLFKLSHPDKKSSVSKAFYKAGITENVEKRKLEIKHVEECWFQVTTQLRASIAEKSVLEIFNTKLTDKFSSSEFDGKGEVFELTENEAKTVKLYIREHLLAQEKPNKHRHIFLKGKKGNN